MKINEKCSEGSEWDTYWLGLFVSLRLLRTQSLEFFYTNVKKRFKRFGSAKVLKTLYRKHLAEHSALSELTGKPLCSLVLWLKPVSIYFGDMTNCLFVFGVVAWHLGLTFTGHRQKQKTNNKESIFRVLNLSCVTHFGKNMASERALKSCIWLVQIFPISLILYWML